MARSSKRPMAEDFDVAEFLRPTDTDLRSALSTLLGNQEPEAEPPVKLTPGPNLIPGLNLTPGPKLEPAIELRPGPELKTVEETPGKRQFAVRRAERVADGHSRAEHQVYQALWDNGEEIGEGGQLRRITVGSATLGRLAGLSESNARINLRNLIRKLAVEEEQTYVCASGRGRTYRVYGEEAVMRRRAVAGMEWFTKRTLAVVFVHPETGDPVLS